MQAKQIIEGHAKLLKNDDKILQDLAAKRLRHCTSCVLFDGHSCNSKRYAEHVDTGAVTKGCGCHMKAKVLVYAAECPLHKWKFRKKPIDLLLESDNWMKTTKNEFTNGDEVIFKKDGTWFYEDAQSNESLIHSYDELLQLING